MVCRLLYAAGGLTFALFLLPAARPGDAAPAKPAALPLTRVVLFNAGVGYFQRDGTVEGTARVDLKFHEDDVNDLLKSLLLEDRDGGRIRAVTYDGRHPIEVTLKSFAVDVTENPTVGQLLMQVRGERIEVTDKAGVVVEGRIIGLERPDPPAVPDKDGKPVPVPVPVQAGEQVNLLTGDGLQSVALKAVKKIRFLRPELEAEFRQALEVLAAARGAAKKTVSLTFAGDGRRRVRVGYVTEAPMWKASYRLSLGDKAATLQGWAAVENTTEEDWTDVRVGLVAGRPLAFQMDLYSPLFVPRPTVEPELFASLRPPEYQGPVGPPVRAGVGVPGGGLGALGGGLGAGGFGGGGFGGGVGGGGGGFGGGVGGFGGRAYGLARPSARQLLGERLSYEELAGRRAEKKEGEDKPADPADKAADRPPQLTAAAAVALGDTFEYRVADPVTLPRLKSALLPVLNEPVETARVSVYNEKVLATHPLLGLRLTNKTKLQLAQGPVTVYEGETYAGDARLPDLKPGETRLVSYAIDLGTEVVPTAGRPESSVEAVRVVAGRVEVRKKTAGVTRYLVRNRSPQPRAVLLEHPVRAGWKLAAPAAPAEQTRDLYRFAVAAKPNEPAALEVVEEFWATEEYPVLTTTNERLREIAAGTRTSPAVRAAIGRVLELRAKMSDAVRAAADEQAGLQAITDDQARIRANLERLPKEADAYKRYLKKLDDQETEIEKRQARVKALRDEAARAEAAYRDYANGLKAE